MPEDIWGTPLEKLLTQEEVAEALSLKPKTLARWRWAGQGPIYRKIGGAVRYAISDIEKFIKDATRHSTSQQED